MTDESATIGRLTLIAAAIGAAMVGAIAGGAAMHANAPAPAGAPTLAMATCTGGLAETPDLEFVIPLDHCDAAIDKIAPQAGFLSKWTICGGATSFDISLDPRAVKVTSEALHCSSSRSEVAATFIGPLKK